MLIPAVNIICVTSDKSLAFSEPWLLHPYNRCSDSTPWGKLYEGPKGKCVKKYSAMCPAQGNGRGLGFSPMPYGSPREQTWISNPKPVLVCLTKGRRPQPGKQGWFLCSENCNLGWVLCVTPLYSLEMPVGQDGPLIHFGFLKPVWDLAPRRGWVNSCEVNECVSEHISKELDPQIFTECLFCIRHFEVRSEMALSLPLGSSQSAGVGYKTPQ